MDPRLYLSSQDFTECLPAFLKGTVVVDRNRVLHKVCKIYPTNARKRRTVYIQHLITGEGEEP